MKKNLIIFIALSIIILVAITIGLALYNNPYQDDFILTEDRSCQNQGGNWLDEFNECEYISQDWCDQTGGQFSECESACRHQPDAQVCTKQCVPVCSFDQSKTISLGYENTSYIIDEQAITLRNGQAEIETFPGSATKSTIKIFENNTKGDFNNDGLEDVAVILTKDQGGSGTFFYIAVALNSVNGYRGTNAILLGDRIAPQSITLLNDVIIADYATRGPNEPMTTTPSINKSIYVVVENNSLREIEYENDLISIKLPAINAIISSPLTVAGQARGGWFFEASFPVILTDWDGRIIAQSHATAKDEWMTENFVDFEGTLEFEKPVYGKRGTLIFQKDNPSGLPEHDNALEIPILFE